MRVVLLKENNRVEEIPDEAVQEGFTRGDYGFVPGERVRVYRRDANDFGTMAPEEARDLILAGGGRVATHAEVQERNLTDRYGSVASGLATVAESAADAATLGAYGAVASAVAPEYGRDIGRRRKANKTERAVGTGIGTVVPLLIPGAGELAGAGSAVRGAAAVGRAATAPLRATAALGRIAETAAARALGEGAVSTAGRVAQRVLPSVVGGAAEGAAIAGAQTISEGVLGDEELTAERLLANIGLGALAGGGIGGGVTGLGMAGAAGARAAGKGVRRLYEAATGSPLSQAIAERYLRTAAPGGRRELLETFLRGSESRAARRAVVDSADDAVASATRQIRSSVDNLDSVDQELTSLARRSNPESLGRLVPAKRIPEQVNAHANAIQGIESRLAQLETAGIYQPKALAKARQALDELPQQIRRAGPDNFGQALFSRTEGLRRTFTELAETADEGTGQALRGLSDDLGKHLGLEDIWGDAAKASRELDTVVNRARGSADNLRQSGIDDPNFARTVQNLDTDSRLSAVSEHANNQRAALDLIRRHGGDESAIARLESKLTAATKSTDDAKGLFKDRILNANRWQELQRLERSNQEDLFFDPSNVAGAIGFSLGGPKGAVAAKYATAAFTTPSRGISLLARLEQAQDFVRKRIDKGVQEWAKGAFAKGSAGARRTAARVASLRAEDFDKKAEQYSKADLAAGIQARISGWSNDAPNTAAMFTAKAAQAASEVQRRMPQPILQSGSLLPTKQAIPISKSEKLSWLRFTRAAENPMTMVEDLENRELSQESVEAVRTLYPKLFESVVAKVQEHLASADKLPPYKDRLQLGILLGVPTDPSLNPERIQATQTTYQVVRQVQNNAEGVRYSTQLKSPEQAQTTAQRIAQQDL